MCVYRVMARHQSERSFLPTPVFEHQTWDLEKISLNAVTSTWVGVGSGTDEVDNVSKFVEKCHDVVVEEESGRCGSRFGKISDQRTSCDLKI